MFPESSPNEPLTLDDIFETYEIPLRRYAFHLVHDLDRADDLVQETMIRAMGSLGLLNRLNAYQRQAWLYKVLKNRFLDEERSLKRRGELTEYLCDRESSVEDNHEISITFEILSQVPEHHRELLEEHYLAGKTTGEIAGELGIPPATVRSRLFLARKWVRDHLGKIQE